MKYKLIKLLPFENSPKIGYISEPHLSQKDEDHYWNGLWFNPENYPEFWQPVVEKNYEILSIKCNKLSLLHFNNVESSINFMLKNDYSIHSVKRLSDGEVFTIGDKIKFQGNGCSDISHISKIIIENNSLYICSAICQFSIKFIEKLKQPLFTTEQRSEIEEIIKNIIKYNSPCKL